MASTTLGAGLGDAAGSATALYGARVTESQEAVIALVGGTVHPVSRPPISNGVVVLRGGQIEAAGPASQVQIPADAQRVDASGRCRFEDVPPGNHVVMLEIEDWVLRLVSGETTTEQTAITEMIDLAAGDERLVRLGHLPAAAPMTALFLAMSRSASCIGLRPGLTRIWTTLPPVLRAFSSCSRQFSSH